VAAVGEPGDVADLDQQPGRTGGSDAVQVQQPGAGRFDQLGELLVGGLGAGVDLLQSITSSVATRLRVLPTTSRGRTEASSCGPGQQTGTPLPRQG